MAESEGESNQMNGSISHSESANGISNGYHEKSSGDSHRHSSSKHKHKDKERRKETEEERRIRKEKERKEREERHKKEGRREETEEERKIRKEKERKEREERHKKEGKRQETEEERRIRKEKERKEREERHKREGKREETEEERRIRKEKERKEREERHRREGKREETEEERRIRKEKERKEREDKHRSKDKRKETEEERRERKERERKERKEREAAEAAEAEAAVKDEPMEEQAEESVEGSIDVKDEPMEESDDEPLAKRGRSTSKSKKRKAAEIESDDENDESWGSKKKNKSTPKIKPKKEVKQERDEDDFKPAKKPPSKKAKQEPETPKKGGKKVKKEETETVWKWWEEEKKALPDGVKWRFLEHKGPVFADAYIPLPHNVHFWYDGKKMKLSEEAEEVATFYGRMLDHDYTTKEVFNKNFFKDWRKMMTDKERDIIRDLSKCDFNEINEYYKKLSEERKNRSKEEKNAEKQKNAAIQEEYGFCTLDGHKEKIGNFRIEPPGLFRGRGEHPKQGMLKKRVTPEDVIINCSKDSDIPEPPEGHRWKEVKHDNTVTWLACWTENVQSQIKYVMLNPASKLKGEKDMMKYEKARQLKQHIDKIRGDYVNDFKSKEMRLRQRAVALYFIDKLALRAGNEKDEDQADTVGCCSLRVEHITLHEESDGKFKAGTSKQNGSKLGQCQAGSRKHKGKEFVVEFDFLGKDSIRYHNEVPVEKRVFKNLQLFCDNKKPGDDLFDRLNTSILNEYLNSLMPGLTAKVFRTYNASITLQEQLEKLTDPDDDLPSKMLSYNRANRAVAILCNHQRAVPKTHDKSMGNLQAKIDGKKEQLQKAEKEFKHAKKAYKNGGAAAEKSNMEKKKKAVERCMEQLQKLETQAVDKEENKTIALGTSKLNYLDPRISVAWCKKHDVPVEKVYNKTQRGKFRWAIDMADEDYEF